MNPAAQKPSVAALAQLFEPIREDLRAVEREFARHVQSQVALIPTIGDYIQNGGGKRIRPAVLLMAARMAGYTGQTVTWDQLMNSTERLGPTEYAWGDVPEEVVAIPGKTTLV